MDYLRRASTSLHQERSGHPEGLSKGVRGASISAILRVGFNGFWELYVTKSLKPDTVNTMQSL